MITTLAGCTGGGEPQILGALRKVESIEEDPSSGLFPAVAAGSTVNATVVVSTRRGPSRGAAVLFTVQSGNGSVGGSATQNVVVGSDGRATVAWRLGNAVGSNTLRVESHGVSTNFVAQTRPGSPARITAQTSQAVGAVVGSAVTPAPRVRIADAFENAVGSGIGVTCARNPGVTSATTTDGNGIATCTWVLDVVAGTKMLTISTAGVAPLPFTAQAVAGSAASLSANSAGSQVAVAGTTTSIAPSVTVRDEHGNTVSGPQVTFTVLAGGGGITTAPGQALSVTRTLSANANGVAALDSWVLGTQAGPNSLAATLAGSSIALVLFDATGIAGLASRISIGAGDGQRATANTVLPISPSVRIVDQHGNAAAVAPCDVVFSVVSGGGQVLAPVRVTPNAQGIATVGGWRLGFSAGQNTMVASCAGLLGSPVTFTATATAVPATVSPVAGDNQVGVVGTAVATRPRVVVRDSFGSVLSGVPVSFVITSGGGVVTGNAVVSSDPNGVAEVDGWILGQSVNDNPNTLAAVVQTQNGPISTTFSATAIAGPSANMIRTSPDPAIGGVNRLLLTSFQPRVLLTDQFGNAVGAGSQVFFSVMSGGGSPNTNAVTAADGTATAAWILGPVAGSNQMRATSPTAGNVFFAAIGRVPAKYAFPSLNDQQVAPRGTTLPVSPGVQILDAQNQPVPGVPVTFSVSMGGGSIGGPATVLTDGNGVARVNTWTLGPLPAGNQLTVFVPGLPFNTLFATGT